MKMDIKLSINKRVESQPNTFILKWNPAISSYTMEQLDEDMEEWAQNWWYDDDFNWSVYEWHKAHEGDRFFMVRVGEGNTGVFAAGRFTSEPYKDKDWSGRGREIYYMDMEFEAVFHPERAAIIPTEALERELPHLDWRKGHSGEMLDGEDAAKLELMWRRFVEESRVVFLPRAAKNKGY